MMGPMQKIYSRHLSRCRYRDDRDHLACDCPKWVQGKIRGQQIRRSTKETSERLAWRVVNDWIENGVPDDEQKLRQDMTVEQAGAEFLHACKANGNRESTLRYKRELVRALVAFCAAKGLRRIADLDAAAAGRFRDSWNQGAAQRAKLQRVLKQFGTWAFDRGLVQDNPAAKLTAIKIRQRKTEPFTQPQMRAILRAVSDYPGDPETITGSSAAIALHGLPRRGCGLPARRRRAR